MAHPTEFSGVTVLTKANLYFDGGVVSHTLRFPTGEKKTLGLIRAGTYHFGTETPERMEIIAGSCDVTLDGSSQSRHYEADEAFEVPGQSGFTVTVNQGCCEYICSFLR
jgi:purine/pyrimidine-nucleoside phosphorylase